MDSQSQLTEALRLLNTFPVPPRPNMSGSNKRKSGAINSSTHTPSQMEWLVIHMRDECNLKSIRYVPYLSKKLLEGSAPILLQHLQANSGALGRIKDMFNYVGNEMNDLGANNVYLCSEDDVNFSWMRHYATNATKILRFLVAKNMGLVDIGKAACDLLVGDQHGLTPTPDGIFYFYPEGKTFTETTNLPQISVGKYSAWMGPPETQTGGRHMIATWETKPPFYSPTLLRKFQDLLDACKENFVEFKMVCGCSSNIPNQ